MNKQHIYEQLFKQYYPHLFVYAQKIVGNDEASDVVEEVFFELWKRKDEIEFGDKIKGFLFRSVYTRCINVLQKRKTNNGYLQLIEDLHAKQLDMLENNSFVSAIDQMENNELKQIINFSISKLPEKCRECFRLSYIHGMHHNDIAEVMDLSVRTVEAHIYRALKQLRTDLKNKVERFC